MELWGQGGVDKGQLGRGSTGEMRGLWGCNTVDFQGKIRNSREIEKREGIRLRDLQIKSCLVSYHS